MLVKLLAKFVRNPVRAAAATVLVSFVPAQAPGDAAGADVVGDDAAAWRQHRAVKVLYAGWPGGSREAAFRAFLERHFDHVAVIDLAKLTKATASPHDVVIADWGSQYGNDGYAKNGDSIHQVPVKLPDDFDVPVVAMGYVASQLRAKRKLDWL
jgi:hypothetical protein